MLRGTQETTMSRRDPFIRGSNPEVPHLFPVRQFGDYTMSVQADRNGYACSPRERFEDIRRYETVEVRISGPNGTMEVQRANFRLSGSLG
jgi:ribosome biogenesis SPOUT family RNA methylase Rps3